MTTIEFTHMPKDENESASRFAKDGKFARNDESDKIWPFMVNEDDANVSQIVLGYTNIT